MSDFNEKFGEYIKFTEDNLRRYNAHSDTMKAQKNLIDAMNYSLEAGGKRIRPVLVYAFCSALGGDYRKACAPAAAIEMIHTFSLIHDDLPAMDNDDFRRGKPSCHKAFGEAMAILAGDALSVLPFEIIANADELSSEQKVKMISCLAKAVGREGMIGGQVQDVYLAGKIYKEKDVLYIHSHKTADMMIGSLLSGLMVYTDDEKLIKALEKYAYNVFCPVSSHLLLFSVSKACHIRLDSPYGKLGPVPQSQL